VFCVQWHHLVVVNRRPPTLSVIQSVCAQEWNSCGLSGLFGGSVGHHDSMKTDEDNWKQIWDQTNVIFANSPTKGSPSDIYKTSSSLLTNVTPNVYVFVYDYVYINTHKRITVITYLMSAISSIRPPFPLYMLAAFNPNFVLATDSRSARVP